MTFPSTLSSFTDPLATDRLNAPSHSGIEQAQNAGIEQVEAVIGLAGSASTIGTIQYDLRSPASDGGGHVQSANKGGTGQTTYTKGDLLVASSSSVLTKLAVTPTNGYSLVADDTSATGVKWGIPNNSPTVRTYSSVVSIWYKPSTLSYAVIEIVGGGGAGAGQASSGPAGTGGGGGGGYGLKVVPAASLPIAASVKAGAGAVAGGIGTASVGGISYFGSVMYVGGGGGGDGVNGGAGGSVLTGNVNINGRTGDFGGGAATIMLGGSGGDSHLGFGAYGRVQTSGSGAQNGSAGQLYGGGGSGGTTADTTDVTGGAGADGIVIIYEY